MSSPAVQKGAHVGKKPGNAGVTYPAEALSKDEVLLLLNTNDAHGGRYAVRDRALFVLLYRTGLRISEALNLMPRDVDFENHAVNVLRGKGGKRRTVGIDEYALDEIALWRGVRASWARPSSPLFCTRDGKHIYPQHIRNKLHRLSDASGLDRRVTPHMFRHTFAAELAREGLPAAYIQRQLGHSSLATTTRYLSTLAPTEVIEAIVARPVPWETNDNPEESA